MPRVLLLALTALVAAAAANDCPVCDRITNQTECQTGRHPTMPGPHNVGCGGHPQKNPDGTTVPYCAWNSTVGKVTTPGCSNCTTAISMPMAKWFCVHKCIYSGPNSVVLQGCSLKDPDCLTNNKKNGGPQWTCYNPNSLNANQTAWKPGSRNYCRANAEIKTILEMCKPHAGGCLDGGCPPPYPPPPPPAYLL